MSLYPGNSATYLHGNYGYPYRGSARRIKPTVLLVVHITGNSSLPSAMAEAQYSARSGSGASFTFVTNRNGTVVQCLHPETQAPWTNGDLNNPLSSVTQAMVGKPYNANEYCFMTAENVGFNPGYPITAAQIDALAKLAAWGSKVSGIPVNRSTILGHRQFNSVSRWNCPTPGDLLAFIDQIITKANAILNPPEDDMILLPIEVFPAGTQAKFAAATTYSLYRIENGQVVRDSLVTLPDRGTWAHAGARVALNGDTAHAGIYLIDGAFAGWVVSGYGAQPVIDKPEDQTDALKARIAAKDKAFDAIVSAASSGKSA